MDTHVDNIVGPDLSPFPGVELRNGDPAVEFNKALRIEYREWCKWAMVDGLHQSQGTRLACRSWLRDGDEFGSSACTWRVGGAASSSACPT